MQEKSNIFNNKRKEAFEVPDGYFECLKMRLGGIPAQKMVAGPAHRIKPYLALAACFVSLLVVGNAVLRNTTSGNEEELYDKYYYISMLQPEEYLHQDTVSHDTISEEDVINYLIDSGATSEMIEYIGLIAQK